MFNKCTEYQIRLKSSFATRMKTKLTQPNLYGLVLTKGENAHYS